MFRRYQSGDVTRFNLICCATMLCLFGQARNGTVATYFILLSSTATSSATGGYVVVPERFDQNEEPAGSNEDRTRKKPNFVPKVDINEAVISHRHKHAFYNFNFFKF